VSGSLQELDGGRVHVAVDGTGPAVVVLESGLGGGVAEWDFVARDLADVAQVVRRDRPGLGASDPTDQPRTPVAAATALKSLLDALGLAPPYVLVGHSLGGLHVRAFACLYPDLVSGVVLVDPSHEDADDEIPHLRTASRAQSWLARTLVRLGRPGRSAFGAIYRASLKSECDPDLPAETAALVERSLAATRGEAAQRAIAAEMAGLEESFAQTRELRAAGGFPDVPLRVISQGRPRRSRFMSGMLGHWHRLHAGLAGLSPQGEHWVAERSGHLVPVEQPEIVVAAVRDVLGAPNAG
jgi:pimeloyl-ACP methyl ester carboxylesterase